MSQEIKSKLGFPGQWQETTLHIPDDEPPPWDPSYNFQTVNKAVPRVDAFAKVTGRAAYATDIRKPGLLYGRLLVSSHPSATIKSIDVSKAKALPGVKAVIVLPIKEVRFVGQEIAAVAATSSQIADDALRLIKVEYDPRPFVVDIETARKEGAPLVFPKRAAQAPEGKSANVTPQRITKRGDIEAGFKHAEHILEGQFRTQVQTHSCLEPHVFTAEWEGDQLTVWASTQSTFSVRDELAQVFEISPSKVRVFSEYMGGGFGSKFGARASGKLAAMLAKEAKASVCLIPSRKEEHLTHGNRPNSAQHFKMGVRNDGTITAMQLTSYGTGGIAGGAAATRPMLGLYRCPNKLAIDEDVFTHAGPARAFRAPGHPQGAFSLEQMVDMCAEKIGMDPLQIRLHNDPHTVRRAQMELGAKRIGWERRNKNPGTQKGPIMRGLGMASSLWYNTGSAGAEILVKIHKDGRVEAFSGGQDIGTGIRTLIAQVVAEELGIPLPLIHVHIGDTQHPYAPGSGGSKTTPCVTPAARKAAFLAKQKLFDLARTLLKLDPKTPMLAQQSRIFSKSDPKMSVDWAQLTRYLPNGILSVQATRNHNYAAYNNIIAGVQFAEVEVDTQTGMIRVLKIVAVHDCGLILNKLTARSQVNGGVIQGISYALFEDRILDPRTGQMVNPNFEHYKIASSREMPEIDAVLFDVYAGSNNTHALGLGEPTTVPTAAAIANAVYNATGARLFELPMTPDRVLKALAQRRSPQK